MGNLTCFFRIILSGIVIFFYTHPLAFSQDLAAVNRSTTAAYNVPVANGQPGDTRSLASVLEELESEYKIHFSYASHLISNKAVNQTEKLHHNANLDELLEHLLSPLGLQFEKIEQDLYLIFQEKSKPPSKMKQKVVPDINNDSTSLKLINRLEKLRSNLTLSQEKTITGKVTDEDDEGLPGVNIIVKNTTLGTVTDVNGNYQLNVPDDATTLVFSSVGYVSEEVNISGRSVISIQMAPDIQALSEVVVVGYGTQKKSDIVGSVYSISEEKLEQNANPNIFQALQGAAPGLNIQRSSGDPGTSGSIQIRGINSISASNEPLIVFDGIPFAGNIRDINPNDIASVEILKDASASAIYGSRAANGVILITSKSGTASGTQVTLNTNWSFQNEAVKYPVMGPEQFYDIREWAWRLDGLLEGVPEENIPSTILEVNEFKSYERGESVDWMDEMINENALRQEYQLSVSTGNEKVKEYFSVAYLAEEGLEESTGFDRINLQNNVELQSLAPWLKIGNNTSLSINNFERRVPGNSGSTAYYRLSPYGRIFEDDGTYTEYPMANDALLGNPVAENNLTTRENKFRNLFNAFYLTVEPGFAPGLSYTARIGVTLRNSFSGVYFPKGTAIGNSLSGSAETYNSELLDLTWENILNYQKSFGDHNLSATALYSRQQSRFEENSAAASGFVSDEYLWHNLGGGSVVGAPSSSLDEWDLVSYMLRVMYDFKNKYYLTVTGRQDGYSGFGEGNKYGFFPSFAVAWRLSDENFMNSVNWLDDLKIRASYGSVGNQAVGTFQSLAQLTNAQPVFGETLFPGVRVSSLPNADLSWETTWSTNLALDFTTLNGRLSGNLEFYDSKTDDILLNRQIPKISGQNDITFNIGKVQNTGIELALNTIPVTSGDFTWKLDVVFSTNRNKILELYGDTQDDIANEWFIGEPLDVIYDYEFGGVWQSGQEAEIAESATPDRAPGDAIIVDQNGDNVISGEDRKIVGYQQPQWIGGLNSTFSYKGLSLNVFVQTVQNRDRAIQNVNNNRFGRVNDIPFNFWTADNPSNEWVRPGINHGLYYGSMNVFEASFTRIKDVTLSYDFPAPVLKAIGLNKLGVFVNLHDYFTFTKFPWIDPESAAAYQLSIPKYVQLGLSVTL